MDLLTRIVGVQEKDTTVGSCQLPKFNLTLIPGRPYFVAGGLFQGVVKIVCKTNNVCFKDFKVELLGYEEIYKTSLLKTEIERHPFVNLKTLISGPNHILSSFDKNQPVSFLSAEKGEHVTPFELELPPSLPTTSTSRGKRPVAIKYLAVGSIKLRLSNGQLYTVNHRLYITIFERVLLNPNENIRLTETPKISEISHSLSDRSHMKLILSVPRMIWVSGNNLSAQLTIQGGIRKRVQRIQVEVLENTRCYRDSGLVPRGFYSEDIASDGEDSTPVDSVTLVNTSSTLGSNTQVGTSLFDSDLVWDSTKDNSNGIDSSRVVIKRTLPMNLAPSQIRLENEERIWNLQLQLPSDIHTIQKAKFIVVNYRLKVMVNFSFSSRLVTELPIMIFHPLSLDNDPYNSLRDGVIITTPHTFEDGRRYKIYEQPLDLRESKLIPTSKSEFISIGRLPQIISPTTTDDSPTTSFFSSNMGSSNDTSPTDITLLPRDVTKLPALEETTLLDKRRKRLSQGFHSVDLSRNYTRSHRRACSETSKNNYFFSSGGAGELPQINDNWDWLAHSMNDSISCKASVRSRSTRASKRGHKSKRKPDMAPLHLPNNSNSLPVLFPDAMTVTPIDEYPPSSKECQVSRSSTIKSNQTNNSTDTTYTVKFPVSPSLPAKHLPPRRRRAASLGGELLAKSAEPSSSFGKSELHPVSPHYQRRYHPEVMARKYSFPPKSDKTLEVPSSASSFPVMSLPLKSALVTHKRAHTYSGPRGVRFSLDTSSIEKLNAHINRKVIELRLAKVEEPDSGIENEDDLSPHSDGIWLTHLDYPPDPVSPPPRFTSSPSWEPVSLQVLPPSPPHRHPSSDSHSSSDSSFVFSVSESAFLAEGFDGVVVAPPPPRHHPPSILSVDR